MSLHFEKIGNEQTLSQKLVEEIKKAIINKELLPGDKLPTENELCEMFGVSRTVVREALQILSGVGLIRIKKGSGIYVEEYSKQAATKAVRLFLELNFEEKYAKHIAQVRRSIEPAIAQLAATYRTASDVGELRKNLEALKQEDDFFKESMIDGQFHLKVAEATHNPIIPLMMEPIYQLLPEIHSMVYEVVSNAKQAAVEWHTVILEAIEEQDQEKAHEAMLAHLNIANQHADQLLQAISEIQEE